MNASTWYEKRNDRTRRYNSRPLDPTKRVLISIEPDFGETVAGQAAAITLSNLLARMTPSVSVDLPPITVQCPLPWAGSSLEDLLVDTMFKADPHGAFRFGPGEAHYKLTLGRNGEGRIVHGAGWTAYVGDRPSPLTARVDENPYGGALAGILAASELFVDELAPPSGRTIMNALRWNESEAQDIPLVLPKTLGNVWVIGAGSVGTAAIYFLGITTRSFYPTIFDMDIVDVENLDRSPIFHNEDVGLAKVSAAERFLHHIGIKKVATENVPLDQSRLWKQRAQGVPDLMISAANERNVRYHIEQGFPPTQIYATTGRNWQATLLRHIPFGRACSCCVFPPDQTTAAMQCATADGSMSVHGVKKPDAALPFLSFAAGLMVAAEVCKLSLPGYPYSQERITLSTRPKPRITASDIPVRPLCCCRDRSVSLHSAMISETLFSRLSC